ncbi:Pancreatic triacylglycerol lipase [Operophtera brumata]|uniref:Pancreatic triacylglycerol lipase n=1 Tax=Operophtera brumata TaxID=104452 RepID=A0A0L7L0W7_OPEBR|nr:Pancreatic triacylglycerol lipase [Operophtera brumata]
MSDSNSTTTPRSDIDPDTADMEPVKLVDCFGLGSVSRSIMKFFNMKPDDSESINTHFYFSSRNNRRRIQIILLQVYPGEQFGLDWVDFKPERRTVMIVHGFMSHSNASWVNDMTSAFLDWGDVNVIAVDWSGGGNTWKYWRAVANTRRVGSDVHMFFQQLINATGVKIKDFHFVGHSLGAHISSFASHLLGGVSRITGLDPAQPCFATTSDAEKLDDTDADYVDIIHTNGRMLKKIGFGMPGPMGHADFYPNGGLKQPGCINSSRSMWSRMLSPTKLQQAVCSHGRAYLLFTEVNSSLNATCDRQHSCAEMGIAAVGEKPSQRAKGQYILLTTDKEPYFLYLRVNSSLNATCDRQHSCAEMGIAAVGEKPSQRAKGQYILLTTDKEPYCVISSLNATCDRQHSCAEMGIAAVGEKPSQRAKGQYILLTTDKEPYCVISSLNATCDRQHSCAEMGIAAVGEKPSQRAKGQYILLTTDKEPYCGKFTSSAV